VSHARHARLPAAIQPFNGRNSCRLTGAGADRSVAIMIKGRACAPCIASN
jgi:hypothetical protein